MRPLRFGVTSGGAPHLTKPSAWRATGRKLEGLGYSTLFVPDHLSMLSSFAPLVLVAESTETLRVGTLVSNSDFYAPLRLAQEAATVDVLTDGRLEFGVGSGWSQPEYALMGLQYDTGSIRAERLGMTIETMKRAWRGDVEVTPAGVQADRGVAKRAVPAPAQFPHPPLLVGGHGDTILRIAARHADIVGITGLTWHGSGLEPAGIAKDVVANRIQFVRDAAPDRDGKIEFNVLVLRTSVGPRGVDDGRAYASEFGLPPGVDEDSPMLLCGEVELIVEKLLKIREQLGISYYVVFESAAEQFAPVIAAVAGR